MPGFADGRTAEEVEEQIKRFERKHGKDEEAQQLVQELREHAHRLQQHKASEDPRESFNTNEFSSAAKTFVDNLRSNFGRPVEHAFLKRHSWSQPILVPLEQPVDTNGQPVSPTGQRSHSQQGA